MLKNAKIYEEEIKVAMREYWYDLRHQYVCGWCGCQDFNVGESNYEAHTFASIDPETGKLLGAIGYNVDWASKSASGFFAESFVDGGSVIFGRDILQVIDDIFRKYHFNRIDWHCWSDNPTIRSYRKLCKRFGGREVGTLKRKGRLIDGFLHDSTIFELLSEDYLSHVEENNE